MTNAGVHHGALSAEHLSEPCRQSVLRRPNDPCTGVGDHGELIPGCMYPSTSNTAWAVKGCAVLDTCVAMRRTMARRMTEQRTSWSRVGAQEGLAITLIPGVTPLACLTATVWYCDAHSVVYGNLHYELVL